MPGLVMDHVIASASRDWVDSNGHNGVDENSASMRETHAHDHSTSERSGATPQQVNGFRRDNGKLSELNSSMTSNHEQSGAVADGILQKLAPPLVHITQGFFPYSRLVNRAVQQCYNDLCDLITELAESAQLQHSAQISSVNGKTDAVALEKRTRILEFAQLKRTEFIKLLVLSQWSRQAFDVSKLIDLQHFIRTRHLAYQTTIQRVADMKRDLVRAQVANPDLQTALEVLMTGRVSSMPEVSRAIMSYFVSESSNQFCSLGINHRSRSVHDAS